MASRTVDTHDTLSDGAETQIFLLNESPFDRLQEQLDTIKSSLPAGTPDAPKIDGVETQIFLLNKSPFDQLQEQDIIIPKSFSQNGMLEHDQCRDHTYGDAASPMLGIHQLKLNQAPRLRVLFQRYEGDAKVTLTAETVQELSVDAPGTTSVLGAMHSRAETAWSCKARRIKVAMFPIPWKDEVLLYNKASRALLLKSMPDGLDVLEIRPKTFAHVHPGFWQLCDSETTVRFLLRPRPYRLLLEDEATKRTAEEPLPPSKRSKQLTRAVGTVEAESSSSVAQDQKALVQPTVVDVDMLTSIGLGQNQTLTVMDRATGQPEYSLKCIDRYLQKSRSADVFKAAWMDGSSRPAVVVVKLHKIAAAAEPYDIIAAVRRWKRELQAHRHLEHPCIPNLLAFDSHLLALIIEYRNCHDLATPHWCYPSGPNARSFKGSLDDACYLILANVSSALAYFGDQGLVHNDIKAGNILYRAADPMSGREASAVVIDFGLARNVKTQPHDSGGGSPWYLAPEWLFNGRRGPPADVFSLGVVMLYLLRHITLPDKGQGWDVNAIQEHSPKAMASMTAWLAHVRRHRDKLHSGSASSKETRIQSLVRQMLFDEDTRISASDLSLQTVEWAA